LAEEGARSFRPCARPQTRSGPYGSGFTRFGGMPFLDNNRSWRAHRYWCGEHVWMEDQIKSGHLETGTAVNPQDVLIRSRKTAEKITERCYLSNPRRMDLRSQRRCSAGLALQAKLPWRQQTTSGPQPQRNPELDFKRGQTTHAPRAGKLVRSVTEPTHDPSHPIG